MARKDRKSRSSKSAKSGPPKSKYANVSKTEVFGAVNYFNRAGRYIIQMNSVEEGSNHNNVDFIQANMTILKSMDGPVSYDYDKRRDGEPIALEMHKVGEEVVDKMMSNNMAFGSNVKKLAMAGGDLTQEDFDNEDHEGQIIEEMVGDDQPLGGVILEVRATQVVKKPARSKDEEDLTNEDVYTRVDYVELLVGEDIEDELDEDTIEKYSIDTSEPDEEAGPDEGDGDN